MDTAGVIVNGETFPSSREAGAVVLDGDDAGAVVPGGGGGSVVVIVVGTVAAGLSAAVDGEATVAPGATPAVACGEGVVTGLSAARGSADTVTVDGAAGASAESVGTGAATAVGGGEIVADGCSAFLGFETLPDRLRAWVCLAETAKVGPRDLAPTPGSLQMLRGPHPLTSGVAPTPGCRTRN